MTSTSIPAAADAAAPLPIAPGSVAKAAAIAKAAQLLLLQLERGQRIDATILRAAMESAFGASDADGGWDWKTAYDACEAATVLFVRKLEDEPPPIPTFLNRLLALTIELQNILSTAFEQLLAARIEGAVASGTYDVGLETLRADSFVVTDRHTIYTHPSTGSETRLLTIAQHERNHPMTLKEALDHLSDSRAVLLHNVRSGYAAVQVPAPSLMRDDGEVERRVRLIRPMARRPLSLKMLAESYWVEADRERFTAAWLAELASIPEFKSSTIYLVTGLLLPIWKRLPHESTRVYRLQTDTGERIIGRKVSPGWVAAATQADTSSLTPEAAFTALLDGKIIVDLTETLQLRRVRVMGADRIELTGFTEMMRDRLRACGLFSEIISWKLRFFVPVDATGSVILARVLERYPIVRIADRAV